VLLNLKSTLAVIEARAKATQVTDPTNSRPISTIQSSAKWCEQFLSRLLVSVERYPDLKANQNFEITR
jgi:LemA protein